MHLSGGDSHFDITTAGLRGIMKTDAIGARLLAGWSSMNKEVRPGYSLKSEAKKKKRHV